MTYTFKPFVPPVIRRGHLDLGGASASGERLDVNSLYIEMDGKPCLPVMGEYQFARAHRGDWYTELCKMKAGGVGIVATYLFWICHEETEGDFDFSGDFDLRAFILDAQRAGLLVFLRPGPWVHGEARNGGFPDWIERGPYRRRTNDPAYLEKVRILYRQYFEQVRGLMWKDGGPIIGFQLDNELSDEAHLAELKRIAEDVGFDVPLWTATGWSGLYGSRIPVREVLAVFGGYPEAPWDSRPGELPPVVHYGFNPIRNDCMIGADLGVGHEPDGWVLPFADYPFATCELGAGNQITHHRRPTFTGLDGYALSLCKLGSGNNLIGYYVYHGGTNPLLRHSPMNESRESGYPNDCPVKSYDFNAPLSEFGEVRESYRLLNLLHLFAADFGELLAPMPAVMSDPEIPVTDFCSLRYAMRTDGKRGFVFVSQYQRRYPLADVPNAVIDTGSVVFPPLDIKDGMSFILPFNLPAGGTTLTYATAQPVCRDKDGDAYFFAVIPGITPVFRFADGTEYTAPNDKIQASDVCGIRLVTLPMSDARFLRRLDGRLYVGIGCDLYAQDGMILSAQPGDYAYLAWEGNRFTTHSVTRPFTQAVLMQTGTDQPFAPVCASELRIGGERRLSWQRLSVSSPDGFVEINDMFDVAQIYADGQLAADAYWDGNPWRVPASLLWGRECFMVTSEQRDDFFREK